MRLRRTAIGLAANCLAAGWLAFATQPASAIDLLDAWRAAQTDAVLKHEIAHPDGTPNNTVGLISFVAMLTLVFVGYALVDASGKKAQEGH